MKLQKPWLSSSLFSFMFIVGHLLMDSLHQDIPRWLAWIAIISFTFLSMLFFESLRFKND